MSPIRREASCLRCGEQLQATENQEICDFCIEIIGEPPTETCIVCFTCGMEYIEPQWVMCPDCLHEEDAATDFVH